jgi:pyruvate dehydrogenase E2 component (dihydrolipoamide acetyltransferase)
VIEFRLPSMGADMDEGKLLEWKVKPGDAVKRGQVVAVVDTSKAAVEVEIWEDGVVSELITQPGETVPVGTVMARLDGISRKPVSPAARKHARELGVDVEKLAGSGPHGAVTVEDVEKAAPKAAAVPLDKGLEMRKAIAAAMARSKREIPHYYLWQTIPMQRAAEWLAAENAKRPVTGRLLMAALQLKAMAVALKGFPDLNGYYRDGAYQPSAAVHAGVAISLRQGGLVAPAIHDAAELPLEELMKALADLVRRARAGSLRSSEMSDPTITLTNLGEGGVDAVFPIIYPPQVAIVGFGAIREGRVVASLGADHRVSDGHRGALYLNALAKLLQEPEKL